MSGADWVVRHRATRILRGTFASLFGLAVKILLQIGQVPVFLHFWSTERFGEWLLVTSIPSYLVLSGLGFGSASGNAIAKLSASGDRKAVRSIIRAVWMLMTLSCVAASIAVVSLTALVDVPRLLSLHDIVGQNLLAVVALLCLLVVVRMQFGFAESGFRAIGQYPTFVVLDNCSQVLDFLATIIALIIWGDPAAVVLAMILVRVVATVVTWQHLVRHDRWLVFGDSDPLWAWIKRLAPPSMGFLIIPISQSLNLQGVLLVVGHFFGPTEAAILATARTLARLVETAINMVYNLAFEEVGYAAGANDTNGLKRILIASTFASAALGLSASCFLLLVGPSLYAVWTHGKIQLDYSVFVAVIAAGLIRAVAVPSAAFLAGLNRHSRYSLVLLGSTLVSLVLAILLTPFGLTGVALSSVVMELAVAIYVFPRGLQVAEMSAGELMRSLRDPASFGLISRLLRRSRPAA